jgi:hypothetical protein
MNLAQTLPARAYLLAYIPGFERLIGQMRHTRGRAYSAGGPVH